ncbi:MAG: LUD domain-containing protein [bacterium]|nr:LUD domain-containing protein [bacterium]
MDTWDTLASDQSIQTATGALAAHGIDVRVVENGQRAKEMVLTLLSPESEVMTMTSVTLDVIGISEEINKANGKFRPVRDKLYAMDKETEAKEMKRLGAAPDVVIGSVHAVTEDGYVLVASATGSQLPAYAYSAGKVIWVVGSQKMVKNVEDGMKRIYEYVLPFEDVRAKKAYGVGSGVNKLLIISKEVIPGRITLIFVKETLGY